MFSKTKTPSELTNSNMLERITLLENNMQHMQQLIQNNQFLIQKVAYLENALNESHQKLERRITDYTDVWHPMMTANIVRIKEELVDTVNASVKSSLDNVIESEVKSIVQSEVKSETQTIVDKLQTLQTKFNDTNIEGHTIIGYNDDRVPAFIHIGYKSIPGDYMHCDDLGLQLNRISRQINTNCLIMTLKSIKQLHNIFNFTTCDLDGFYNLALIDDNRNDISLRATERCECKKFYIGSTLYNKTNAQYLLSILDELKIKIVFQGSESYNQMPLRRYIL